MVGWRVRDSPEGIETEADPRGMELVMVECVVWPDCDA